MDIPTTTTIPELLDRPEPLIAWLETRPKGWRGYSRKYSSCPIAKFLKDITGRQYTVNALKVLGSPGSVGYLNPSWLSYTITQIDDVDRKSAGANTALKLVYYGIERQNSCAGVWGIPVLIVNRELVEQFKQTFIAKEKTE